MLRLLRPLTRWLGAGCICLSIADASAATNLSAWVFPGPSGRLLARPDFLGNRVMDVSGVGYKGGLVPLPGTNLVVVRTNIAPVAGDNRNHIQGAINYVQSLPLDANGFRGAVLLAPGEYPMASSVMISASGVVLRGSGSGTNGTVLRATATNQYSLVRVTGSGSASTVSGTTHNITNHYTPVGARSFLVDSTGGLAVGDRVFVRRIATQQWIDDLGMNLLCCPPDVNPWTPGGYHIDMDRVITRIEGNRVFIDAPVTCAIDRGYTNGTIRKYTWSARIQNSGVERLRGVSGYAAADDENHGWVFVQFNSIEHGWAHNLVSQYFGYACVALYGGSRFVTVSDCQALDPISIVTGGRRYAFVMDDCTMCLVKNCYNRQDRHLFVTQSLTTGPNVFVDGLADSARSDGGPHHRWATGAVWDNITINGNNLNIQNRGNLGSGHGWAGGNCIAYNCDADGGYVVQNPPTARNWLIGSIGNIENGTVYVGPHDPGTYDSHGTNVFPNSLYYAQLQDRLAAPNLKTREYWLGDIDRFANTNASGEGVPVDAAWQTAVAAAAAGQPVDGFDVVTNAHWVPFTFNYSLAVTDRVVAASLTLCMRSTSGGGGATLHLDATNNAFSFASLGLSPVTTSTNASNATVRVMDLLAHTNLLADGKLNLAVAGDVGIDWALLQLEVAPALSAGTFPLAPLADATVRGGTGAAINFGNAATLTVREDASANNDQKAYLRWDLSSVTGTVYHAAIRLTPVSVGTNNVECAVAVSTNHAWSEAGITWNNQPGGGKRFATRIPGTNQPVEFAVTPQVLDALAGDKQLSVLLYSIRDIGSAGSVEFAAREAPNSAIRPQLLLAVSQAPPQISDLSNLSVAVGASTGPLAFDVSDNETAASNLVVGAQTSNTNLVPPANIVFGGSGSNRTVTVTAASGESGLATITITVTDEAGLSSSDSFTLTVSSHPPGVFVWNGPGAGAHNWSTGGNWSPAGPPEALDDVKFFDTGAGGVAVSNMNNVVDAGFGGTVASLQFGNTNGNHTTLISPGQTLGVSGPGGLFVGTGQDNGANQLVNATITGVGGALVLDNPAASLNVRQGSTNSGSHRATLNLSGLDSLSANVARLLIAGDGSSAPANNRPGGTLLLARTNVIVASGSSPAINLADGPSNGGNGVLSLGRTNAIYADTITVGRQKSSATMNFNPAFTNQMPSLYLRGTSAERVASLAIGDNSPQGTSGSPSSGTVDWSGGIVDVMAGSVIVGRGQTSDGTGGATGVLSLTAGTLDVDTLEAGYQNATTAASVVSGTVNVGGVAALVLNTNLRLARYTGSGTVPVGTLNVNGGSISGAGSITAGGGTASLNAKNAMLSLLGSIGTPGAPLTSLTLTNSTLELTFTANTTNVATAALATGPGANMLNIVVLPNLTSFPTQLTLIEYSGAMGGAGFNFVLGTLPVGEAYQGFLSNNAAGSSVDLVITNRLIPDPFLLWNGDVDGDWDTTTANWKNNIGPGLIYSAGDVVRFDDSVSGATNINLTATLTPGGITVSNLTRAFAFVDEGRISGGTGLRKQGAGMLILGNEGNNDFTGGVRIDGGTIQVGTGGTNGTFGTGAVTNNGTLIFNRSDQITLGQLFSGGGTFIKNSTNTILVTNNNSAFMGVVHVNGGVLRANSSAQALGGGQVNVAEGAVAYLNVGAVYPCSFAIAGIGVQEAGGNFGALRLAANGATVSNSITLTGDARITARLASSSGATLAGPISGGFRLEFNNCGDNTGLLAISHPSNNWTGGTVIGHGTLRLGASEVIPNGAVAGSVTLSNTSTSFDTVLNLSGFTETINSLNSAGADPSRCIITNGSVAPATLVVGDGNASGAFGGVIKNGIGAVALTKIGNGTQTLDGVNSHTGATVVNAGTLGGSGTIGGTLTVNAGGTFSPGNSIGVFTVSNSVTLLGMVVMELNAMQATNDQLKGGASIAFGGTLLLTNLAGVLTTNHTFNLFSATSYSGAFASLRPAIPALNMAWNTNTLVGDGTLRIASAPTPQPSITAPNSDGAGITFTGTNGVPGWPCHVLTATNLLQPVSAWDVLATNVFGSEGSFTFTSALSSGSPQRFYLLRMQ
jgi:autotransporter-associated beta strand protein